MTKSLSLILIDPQIGFCSPMGSLGLRYGDCELREIKKTVVNIQTVLAKCERRHMVSSEYSVAQFTGGDEKHALANLCVPGINQDCHIVDEFSSFNFDSYCIKHEQSALSSSKFLSEIETDIELGIKHFVVAGFLLEHCVSKTAEDLYEHLKGRGVDVIVCNDLTASRTEKYKANIVMSQIDKLKSKGIKVAPWQSI